MSLRIAVCDDEERIAHQICEKLQNRYRNAHVDEYHSGKNLLENCKTRNAYDIFILDVLMPKESGMDVAKRLRENGANGLIIFLTGDESSVFEAFTVEAFRYLLKPVEDARLFETLDLAREKLEENQKNSEDDYLWISFGGVVNRIRIKEIIMAEIYNRKITIHTLSGSYDYYGRLNELLEKIGDDFMSPHRSYVIHLKYVEGYDAHEIRLTNGYTAILAKKKYQEFVRTYSRFIRR